MRLCLNCGGKVPGSEDLVREFRPGDVHVPREVAELIARATAADGDCCGVPCWEAYQAGKLQQARADLARAMELRASREVLAELASFFRGCRAAGEVITGAHAKRWAERIDQVLALKGGAQ